MTVISLSEVTAKNKIRDLLRSEEIFHLPVAPQVTARTRFASTVPKKVQYMMPAEALTMLENEMENREKPITMVAISGPGDPFAVPDTTLKTVELVREKYPDFKIGLKTLGIGGELFAADLAAAGVDYVELKVDGVKAEILEKLYAWIRPGLKTLKISEAVTLLLEEQRNCVPALKYAGLSVSIVTTLYPGHNVGHIKNISEQMMELGADSISVIPYKPEVDAEVRLNPPDSEMIRAAEEAAQKYLPLVPPLLDQWGIETTGQSHDFKKQLPGPCHARRYVAVVSSNGMDVDLHLGQARNILIYGPREDGLVCLFESRKAPQPGGGADRWQELAELLDDCFALLALSAGDRPKRILSEHGLSVLLTDENIEGIVDVLYGGGKKGKMKHA